MSNLYGFRKAYHPFVYLSSGVLLGGLDEFSEYVRGKYGISKEENDLGIIMKLTNSNIKKANKELKLVLD